MGRMYGERLNILSGVQNKTYIKIKYIAHTHPDKSYISQATVKGHFKMNIEALKWLMLKKEKLKVSCFHS